MTCGHGMPIYFEQTTRERAEIEHWAAGEGPQTAAVLRAIERTGLTFGIALITRNRFGANNDFIRN